MKSFIKTHQQALVLLIGYLLVAGISFASGRITAFKYSAPDIRVEEAFAPPINYNPNQPAVQSAVTQTGQLDCAGKIKGNIGSGTKIYHMPGGSFYNRTNPEMCFSTEAEAQGAGFRKSSR